MRHSLLIWLTRSMLGIVVLCNPLVSLAQSQPEPVAAVAPEWPALARKAKEPKTKIVRVKVMMDGFGNVVDATAVPSHSPYSDAALRAAWLWKFGSVFVRNKEKNTNRMTVTLKFTFRMLPRSTPSSEIGTTFLPPYGVELNRYVLEQ